MVFYNTQFETYGRKKECTCKIKIILDELENMSLFWINLGSTSH